MSHRLFITFILFVLALTSQLRAQQKEEITEPHPAAHSENEEFKPHSTIGLIVSHAHVFAGRDVNGDKKVLALASWGIDYNYHISPKWAVGLHTDIILESFKVEKHGGETIERSYPIAPAFMGIFKPNHHWSLMAGMGAEFAKEENFVLTRFGVEYGVEIRNGWEVLGSLAYDIKWDAYDSWVLGLGISKAFGSRHNQKITIHEN